MRLVGVARDDGDHDEPQGADAVQRIRRGLDQNERTYPVMSDLRPEREHVVLLVHGIRTSARWVGMVKQTLESASSGHLKVEPVSYGVFSLWRFLVPGPWRRAAVETVARYINAVRRRDDDLSASKSPV
jgi:hypothetical protein